MTKPYTLADLQVIDDQCQEIARNDLGFEIPEIIYHLVRPEEIYFAAATGLPARYSSARWGANYDSEYGKYLRGEGRIYELIFNTDPVHAYLMDGNSLTAQTLIIAHCLLHGFVFENNKWLGGVDRHIMPRVLSAADRINEYMGIYGRDRVEDFLDSCHAVAIHQPQAQLITKAEKSEPVEQTTKYDMLFPVETAAEQQRVVAERDALRQRFPREPQANLLQFIEKHARGLEDWQKDIMSIVSSEQSYFLPQMRTKILNEGAAVLGHQEICQRLFLPSDQYWEYEQLNSGVVQPHPGSVNPYNIGINIMREIMRIAETPDAAEKEQWSWAGNISGFDKVREVIRDYDDEGLLREFLTPKVCELSRLYAFERPHKDRRQIRITSRECDEIRNILIPRHSTFGLPHIEIVDADYRSRGELYMEHRHEGIGLDGEYARGTLGEIASLWGRSVVIKTIEANDEDSPMWYIGNPNGEASSHSKDPVNL